MTNILVTGGAGFIGSNFIRYVFEKTDFQGNIINYDALTYAGNYLNLEDIEAKFKDRYIFVKGDIRDTKALKEVFEKYQIDTVVHFAAESHVDRSLVNPDEFITTNINGTFNLLNQAKNQKNFERFHHVSTDEVFGSCKEGELFSEKTPYDPHSPYSASKASSDHLVRAFKDSFGLPITISNCSNNYGPYQFPEKLVPLMIMNSVEYKYLPVYGNGLNIRDWLYVEDHCSAIWTILTKGKVGETYCIGGNCEITNIDVVTMICDLVDEYFDIRQNSRRSLIKYVSDRPGHDLRYAIDTTKIKTELGWNQTVDKKTGFRKTVEWYLNHKDWIETIKNGDYLKAWMAKNYGSRKIS